MYNSMLSNATLYGTGLNNLTTSGSKKLREFNEEVSKKLENWRQSVKDFELSNFSFFKKHGWANEDIPKIFYQKDFTDIVYDKRKCGYIFSHSTHDDNFQTMADGGNIPCTIATMMQALKFKSNLGASPYVVGRTLYNNNYILEDNSTDILAMDKFFLDTVIGVNTVAESVDELYTALDGHKVVSALVDSKLLHHENSSFEECINIWRFSGACAVVSSSLSPLPVHTVKLEDLFKATQRAWILTSI